jgi:hypothetical protein
VNAPEILLKAADVIETRGHHKGGFYDVTAHITGNRPIEECAVCLRGAINVAAGWHPDGDVRAVSTLIDAIDALALHLGCDLDETESSADFVSYWNDLTCTSAEQVTAVLRACAAQLQENA